MDSMPCCDFDVDPPAFQKIDTCFAERKIRCHCPLAQPMLVAM
jgi:hypothetical protein